MEVRVIVYLIVIIIIRFYLTINELMERKPMFNQSINRVLDIKHTQSGAAGVISLCNMYKVDQKRTFHFISRFAGSRHL